MRIFLNHNKLLEACRVGLEKNDLAFLECDLAFLECTVDEFRSWATKDDKSESTYYAICQAIAEKRFFFRNPKETKPQVYDFRVWIRRNGWAEFWWNSLPLRYSAKIAKKEMEETGLFDSVQIIL